MITIKSPAETCLIVKKSKFIGLACRVKTEMEAQEALDLRRKRHYDATHNCYAYLLENGAQRCSDDGEPQGTAGRPILDVIKKSGISDVLVISTRYFGGILLGAGGLTRAYSQSVSETLKEAEKSELLPFSVYKCVFPYGAWARAEKILRGAGYAPGNIIYSDSVAAEINVPEGAEGFAEFIRDLTLGQTEPLLLGRKLVETRTFR
jgi:uncharacterized YigZ family protein